MWGATCTTIFTANKITFQSTLPVWGATNGIFTNRHHLPISIHAPRVGSDTTAKRSSLMPTFQSTLPVWGATKAVSSNTGSIANFNPRSPCGERLLRSQSFDLAALISIHAPRVGSDTRIGAPPPARLKISIHAPRVGSDSRHLHHHQPGHISIHAPRVGSDSLPLRLAVRLQISIHAPRVGSDNRNQVTSVKTGNFNPRSPCGERLGAIGNVLDSALFQSTLPVWGATEVITINFKTFLFQSTLPVWGATWNHIFTVSDTDFNPRSPCGERLIVMVFNAI